MKTIVFNDTSRFHRGSEVVMNVLFNEARQSGLEVIESVFGNTWLFSKSYPLVSPEAFHDAELFLINGEGTMHDDGKLAVFFIEEIAAKRGNRKLAIVNSLWQRMNPAYKRILEGADLVVLREPASHQELGLPSAQMMPDLSYYDVPVYSKLPSQGRVKGTFYGGVQGDLKLDSAMNISTEPWRGLVNKLRHADVCVTGKHHEVIAACVARCPFVSTRLATHKVSGLGAYIGQDLITIAPDATPDEVERALEKAEKDLDGTYQRLFDKMESLRENMRLGEILGKLVK